MRIFELGPGRKFRATTGPSGQIRIEVRTPTRWEPITAPDLTQVATNALALVAVGEPPAGFRLTQDEQYSEAQLSNPFEARARRHR